MPKGDPLVSDLNKTSVPADQSVPTPPEPTPSMPSIQDLEKEKTPIPDLPVEPVVSEPDPSLIGKLPPLPLNEKQEVIPVPTINSMPDTMAQFPQPQKTDSSVLMTVLVFFMLLVSGLGIYLYVAYTNLAAQNVTQEVNAVSFSSN